MRQFILPEDWDGGPECVVRGGRARYLLRVLRLRTTDRFVGMDSSGTRWLCSLRDYGSENGIDLLRLKIDPLPAGHAPLELRDLRGGAGTGSLSAAAAILAEPADTGLNKDSWARSKNSTPEYRTSPPITLIQGLPKGVKMDLIVRQATEAGVRRIMPLISRHCLRQTGKDAKAKFSRWERIAREALQQSGSTVPTRVDAPVDLAALGAALGSNGPSGGALRLLLHETPLAQASLHGYLTETPSEVVLCVGPEGGFAVDEVAFLREAGFLPLRFAGAILRTETAALYAVASVNIILSERSSWMPKPL